MKKVLTDAFVRGVKPPETGRIEIADLRCTGLSFRVTSNGARSWCFRFRDPENGRTTRGTIGTYPTVKLGSARERADAMRQAVTAGINPVARKRTERASAGDRTFKALTERYMTEHALRHKRPRSAAEDRRNLDLHVLPRWGKRPFASIHRADVIELIEEIIGDGKQTAANRVHALISKVFSFAIDAALTETNPCSRLKKRGVERTGDRVLSDGELRLFWSGIVESKKARRTGLALRLALLTGVRRSEASGIRRSELVEIDKPSDAAWLLPGNRTKNGYELLLPLAPLARQIVLELLDTTREGEQFLLPTRSGRRSGCIHEKTLSQAMEHLAVRIKRQVKESSPADDPARTWIVDAPSPHDLRRTVQTRMAGLGIAKEIRDRVLNHVPNDVGSKHYDRHDYVAEKRAALVQWNDALAEILHIPTQ